MFWQLGGDDPTFILKGGWKVEWDKLAEKFAEMNSVEERKKEKKLKIIKMLKLYFYTKLRAGFENTHEIETHIHTKKSDVSVKNVIS